MGKKICFLFFFILIIALFFRLWNINKIPPGLYSDEAINGNDALIALQTCNFKVFYPENNGREGLFINIEALFLKFFLLFDSPQPWMLRIVSAIFGILTTIGLFFLTKQLFNKEVAIYSFFLLAVSFWHINFSRIGFRAIMVSFCLVWAFYFLLRALEKHDWKNIIASAIFFGIGFHTYIAFRVAPLIMFIVFVYYFLIYRRQKNLKIFWKLFLIWISVVFLIVLPMGLYFLNHPQDFLGRSTQVSIFNTAYPLWEFIKSFLKTLIMFNFFGDCNWRHNYSCRPQLDIITGIFFLIGLILIIKKLIRRQIEFSSIFLIVWFLVMILPAALTYESVPHALRSIGLIPAVFIFSGLGFYNFSRWLDSRPVSTKNRSFILIIICFIILSLNYLQYFQKWAKNSNTYNAFNGNYYQIGKYLNSLPLSQLKIVLVNADGILVNDIPMPAQTVMFITNTYAEKNQKEKNLFYLLPNQIDLVNQPSSFVLIPLEKKEETKNLILQSFPTINFREYSDFWVFQLQ